MIIDKEDLIQKQDIKTINLEDIVFDEKDGNIRYAMKMYFVIADQFKQELSKEIRTKRPWEGRLLISREKFMELYERVYNWASMLDEEELDRWVYCPGPPVNGPDLSRLWRFNEAEWGIETVPLEEIGVWPRYFGVDHSVTTGNVIKTAEIIKPYLDGDADDMVTKKAIDVANSMMEYADLISLLFPLILIKTGKNTRRPFENSNIEEVQARNLFYESTGNETEDGAARAVAFALSGVNQVKCFVGRGLQETYPPKDEEADLRSYVS